MLKPGHSKAYSRGGGLSDSLTESSGAAKLLSLFCNHCYTRYFSVVRKTKPAFSLAEVIITIGIIGVVASMLLITVVPNVERARNAAVLRRAYADLSVYVNKFAQENECSTYLTDCAPNGGQFVWEFAKFLHDEQKFVEVDSRCKGQKNCSTWFRYRPNGQSDGITLGQVFTVATPHKAYYLESPTGLYTYYISVHMYDNYYNIKGDTFRARIHIITDMKYRGYFKNGYGDDGKGNRTHSPQLGRNMFEVYVMNSKKVLPNGTSLCGGIRESWAYYCHSLDTSAEGNCSYESGDFTACFQKVINDGWKIKYRY